MSESSHLLLLLAVLPPNPFDVWSPRGSYTGRAFPFLQRSNNNKRPCILHPAVQAGACVRDRFDLLSTALSPSSPPSRSLLLAAIHCWRIFAFDDNSINLFFSFGARQGLAFETREHA